LDGTTDGIEKILDRAQIQGEAAVGLGDGTMRAVWR
jgi:hypothetical protein